MNKTIHKLSVPSLTGKHSFAIPKGAVFVSCKKQGQHIAAWYTTKERHNTAMVDVFVCMTGQDVDPKAIYIGTVQYEDEAIGFFVLHLFAKFVS